MSGSVSVWIGRCLLSLGCGGLQKILISMPGFEPKLAKLLSKMKQTNFSAFLKSGG